MAKGIMKALTLSDDLADFMGKSKASRADVTKKIWAHIKKHDLQDEVKRRTIHPDDVLEPILGSKSLTMFEIPKKLTKHFLD